MKYIEKENEKHFLCSCVCVTCPVQRPTTRSAIKVSSVSPERWLTITPQPFSWASLHLRGTNRAKKHIHHVLSQTAGTFVHI